MTAVSPGPPITKLIILLSLLIAAAAACNCSCTVAAKCGGSEEQHFCLFEFGGCSSSSESEMAPKNVLSSKSKAAAKSKTVKKDTSSNITKKSVSQGDYPGQLDRWKGKRQAKCDSCGQKTSTIDRHSPPDKPKYLHWVQKRKATQASTAAAAGTDAKTLTTMMKAGDLEYPGGGECYPCYNMRRKFHLGKSQEELDEERKTNQELDDQCNAQRHDAVSEKNELKGAVKEATVSVGKGAKDFDRRLVTGSLQPVWEFASRRNLTVEPPDCLDSLVTLIENKYPDYKVIVDKEERVCVDIPDQTGGECRYERGAESFTSYKKYEKFDDKRQAKEHYDNLTAKTQCEDDDRIVADAAASDPTRRRSGSSSASASASISPGVKDKVQQMLNRPSPSKAFKAGPRSPIIINDTLDQAAESTVPGLDDEQAATEEDLDLDLDSEYGKHAGLLPSASAASAAAGRRRSSGASASDDGSATVLEDGQGNGLESEASFGKATNATATKRSAADRDMEEGKKALVHALKNFGQDAHIEHSRQAKSCDAAVARLRKWARKIGKSKVKDHQDFSQTLHDLADEVEHRQALFEDARTRLASVVMEVPTKPRLAILNTMEATTVCSLIGREAAGANISMAALTNSTEAQALFLVLSGPGSPRSAQGLGLHYVKGNNCLVKTTQRPALHSHLDRVFKSEDHSIMASRIKNFVFTFASQPED